MFSAFGAWDTCSECGISYQRKSDHTCEREAVIRHQARHLETEIETWLTKTNEGRFAIFYAEWRRKRA